MHKGNASPPSPDQSTDQSRPGTDAQAETRRRFAEQMRRAGQQAEKLTGGAGLPAEEAGAPQEEFNDWPEKWGPRVGRALGYAFALYLIWHLLTTYVLK